jgi:atypical dual specificity phosphatase
MENNEDGSIPKLSQLLTTQEIKKSNNINKITDKIYLGDDEGAKEFDYLRAEQIHYVLSFVANPPVYPEDMKINLMHINLEETLSINIITYTKQCISFIDNADKIFIHCTCGINRSPAIVIGYLMWKTHSNYDDVFNYVKQKRECIQPINPFIIQLKKFHTLLTKNNYNLDQVIVNTRTKSLK